MRTTSLPDGRAVPVLGQGTWNMGDDPACRDEEIDALRTGIDLGMNLIDTAEMYGGGASEKLVGRAIDGRRDEVFLVSKVLPDNADRRGTVAACERSLRRLGTDRIDLYLLHWRGHVPLAETVEAFEALKAAGKILHWGVSNFDVDDMEELVSIDGGDRAASNQVLYNLTRRGIEYDLLPWCAARRMPVMAYSPIEQGRLAEHPGLEAVANSHGTTPAQLALAWAVRSGDVIAIPKASSAAHVRDNHAALALTLEQADLDALDRIFAPPRRAQPLEMI